MRFLGPADFLDMPWKNGGGRLLQLAIHPPGATWETFDWRVSIATVERSGPFSAFPNCTRTLMLLDGDGFELDIAGRRVVLDRPLEPVTFSGDEPASCRLLGGPSRDFGVIARGRAMQLVVFRGSFSGPATLVYALQGTLRTPAGPVPQGAAVLEADGELTTDGCGIAVRSS